jgi:lipopolysaccharide O-acetyltransferase
MLKIKFRNCVLASGGKMIFGTAFRYIKLNGWFLFVVEVARRTSSILRNRIIARRFGLTRLRVGPRALIRGLANIEIGDNFSSGEGLWLEAITAYNEQSFSPRIIIGKNVSVSHWTHIAATNRVEIGDNVLIGSKVIITDHNHGQYDGSSTSSSPKVPPAARLLDSRKTTVIGNNVWIGDGAVIGAGSVVGAGAVIGANSVVIGEIPANTIAAGVPAVCLKFYDFDKCGWVKTDADRVN